MRVCSQPPALALLALVLGCPAKKAPPPPVPQALLSGEGFIVQVSAAPFSLRVVDSQGATRLATPEGDGPRATWNVPTFSGQLIPGWDGYVSNEMPWTVASMGTLVRVDDQSVKLTLSASGTTFTVTIQAVGPRVLYRQTAVGPQFNKSALAFTLPPNSHFFGMGERYATVDHLGQSLYSWPEEGGLGGGEDGGPGPTNPYPNGPSMTYFPVPFFHTTHGLSALIDTPYRSEVHFGTDADAPGTWRVAVDDTELDLTLYVRDQPLDAIADYTQDTGRPPIPAPWAWGPRRRIDGEGQVDGGDEWQVMRDLHLPLTTIDDTMHSLPDDSQQGIEDQLKAWTQTLHQHGYKVVDYNNPYVSASVPRMAADYAYGASKGYFESLPDGGPATTFFISGQAQTVSAVDLSNPDAEAWFHTLLQRSLDLGYDGWMHDFGEYVARTSHFANGVSGYAMHNQFPRYSVKAAKDLMDAQRPDGDYDFFVRSGYVGSQAYAVEVWGGDPEASFDNTQGMPAMLRGGLNLGMVGVPYWGSDMGGFKCITNAPHDKEMLVRWYEMGAVSAMMHDENACANPISGGGTKAKLWDDLQTQQIYGAMASLHTRLAPYFRALAEVSHTTGEPIMRHPFLLNPTASDAWGVEDSFFLGPALYAAPVVRRGVTTRHLWLPPGTFLELNGFQPFTGPGYVDVPAPLQTLPLFLVANQILPLLDPDVQTLVASADTTVVTEQTRAGVLDARVALPHGGTASMTLTDGTVLTASRTASGNAPPVPLTTATQATISTCALCGLVDAVGGVGRVRVNGAAEASSGASLADITVQASGGPPRRVRWEVFELP